MTNLPAQLPIKQSTFARWELLALLWLAFFLNQADRQIYGVVLPLIKRDMHLSDSELGLIASALFWTYGLLVPVAGFLGDKFQKKRIITFCLLFWSCATLLTGSCTSLLQFMLVRGVATGGGEAFYAPSANALLSQQYPRNRSFVLSIHQTAVYIGITLSGLIAGYVSERYGWRNAFYGFGTAGVLLAIVLMKRLRPESQWQEKAIATSFIKTATIIYRKPTVWCLTIAFACMVFVTVGYQTWIPSFMFEKFHLTLAEAGFYSLFYHHAGAFVGVLIGGRLSDQLASTRPRYRLVIQSAALLLATPFIVCVGLGGQARAVYTALSLFGVFRGIYDSNIFASLYEVVSPDMRSSATGLMLMFAFLVGAFLPLRAGGAEAYAGPVTQPVRLIRQLRAGRYRYWHCGHFLL